MMLSDVVNICHKWYLVSVDVKANVKQWQINYLVAAVSYKFLQEVPWNTMWKGHVFLFDFGWYSIPLDIVR